MDYNHIFNLVKNEEIDISDIPNEFLDEKMVWQIINDDYFTIRFFSVSGEEKPITDAILKSKKLFAIWQVYNNGEFIKNIKEDLIDEKLCKLAVSCGNNSENAIKYIPKKYINEDICYYAILNGASLKHVPNEFKNRSLYNLAVYKRFDNLKFVPKEYKDFNLYKNAVQGNYQALNIVPKQFKNEELYLAAIERTYLSLRIIPEEEITEKMCETAVDNMGMGLSLVPEKYKTTELCMRAFKKDGRVVAFFPQEIYDFIETDKLINSFPYAIQFIPSKYLSYKSYKIAVSQFESLLRFVPSEWKDKEMYLSAVEGLGYMPITGDNRFFNELPNKFKNFEFFCECVNRNGDVIGCRPVYLNNIEFTYKLYLQAVQSRGKAIRFVPKKFWNEEIIKISLKANVSKFGSPLKIIINNCKNYKTLDLLTQEIFDLAVHKSPKALEDVPLQFKTLEMCQKAYLRTKKIISFIPKEFHDKLESFQKKNSKEDKLEKKKENELLEKNILELLINYPNTTIKQIMTIFGENENKITTIVRRLRREGRVLTFIQDSPVQLSIKKALQQKALTKMELVKITGKTYKSIEKALTTMKKNNIVLNENGVWYLI